MHYRTLLESTSSCMHLFEGDFESILDLSVQVRRPRARPNDRSHLLHTLTSAYSTKACPNHHHTTISRPRRKRGMNSHNRCLFCAQIFMGKCAMVVDAVANDGPREQS